MSTARLKTENLLARLERSGIAATFAQAETLRRAARTLQRWYELECGAGNDWASWSIERADNGDGPPYLATYPHNGKPHRRRIADREAGAKRRVERVAAELGVYVRYQTDPCGAALYVSREPMPEDGSHRGVCCEVQ